VRWPFAGIHVISPRIFERITETGAFSIVDVYLRLAAEGERIVPWDAGDALWLEIGSPDRLEAARRALEAP
jgi:NDP-sugar pyrophosphorylase family protein